MSFLPLILLLIFPSFAASADDSATISSSDRLQEYPLISEWSYNRVLEPLNLDSRQKKHRMLLVNTSYSGASSLMISLEKQSPEGRVPLYHVEVREPGSDGGEGYVRYYADVYRSAISADEFDHVTQLLEQAATNRPLNTVYCSHCLKVRIDSAIVPDFVPDTKIIPMQDSVPVDFTIAQVFADIAARNIDELPELATEFSSMIDAEIAETIRDCKKLKESVPNTQCLEQ